MSVLFDSLFSYIFLSTWLSFSFSMCLCLCLSPFLIKFLNLFLYSCYLSCCLSLLNIVLVLKYIRFHRISNQNHFHGLKMCVCVFCCFFVGCDTYNALSSGILNKKIEGEIQTHLITCGAKDTLKWVQKLLTLAN